MKQFIINIPDSATMVNLKIIIRDNVAEVVSDHQYDAHQIIDQVILYTGFPLEILKSETRLRNIANARKLIFMFLKHYTKLSFSEIGMTLNRDHTTVIAAIKRGYGWIDVKDKQFTAIYNEMSKILSDRLRDNSNVSSVITN